MITTLTLFKNKNQLVIALLKIIIFSMIGFSLSGCLDDAKTLSPEPSALEKDDVGPSCPGISAVTVTSGPTLTAVWGQATDNYSEASKMTYKVFMRKGTESYDLVSPAKIIQGATSTLITNGVSVGNTYTLFVICSDEKGNSYPSGPLLEYTVTVSDTQAPSQISNLSAGNQTFTSVLLTWSPSDDGAGGTTAGNMSYKVYASSTSPVSTSGSATATLSNGTTSYLHSGLNPSATWYYKVIAVDSVGNLSVASNESSATTTADTTAPTFGGGTTSTVVNTTTSSAISFSWSAATDNVNSASALSYRIYRCTGLTTCDPFAATLVTTLTNGTLTYTDSGLNSSTVYVYGIRAVDYANNVSTNTDKKVTSTAYVSSGSFYAYSTIDEVNIRLGQAVAVANVVGDATGANAFPDLIVGAPNGSEAGGSWRWTGCVYIFAGTATGTFSTTATGVFCAPSALVDGTQNGLNFGSAVAVGDMDLDTYSDIIVSDPLRGKVYIYRSQISGGVLTIGVTPSTIPHPTLNATFGTGICVGNSDNVGADDLFIATTSENCNVACGGATGTGNLLVFNNTSTAGNFIAPSVLSYKVSPTNSLQTAGYAIANSEVVVRSCTLGNFDAASPTQLQLVIGSGTVAFTAAAATDGMIAFYRKTAADTFVFQNVIPTTTPSITGNNWGNSLSRIQLDTGEHELVVGAPNDSNAGAVSGAVFLYTVGTSVSNFTLTDTGQTYYGGTDFDNNAAGSSVAVANIWGHTANTKEDLVVGAYLDDNTNTIGASGINLGQVFTYKNVSGTIAPTAIQKSFDTSNYRVKNDSLYGTALCKGDVNNDGKDDVIVGAPNTDYDPTTMTVNNNVGAVYIYYGVTAGEIDFVNPSQILYAPGSQSGGGFGYSCVVMDYNADSKNDLLIGSPYRDVVQADRGAVFVYYGSANSDLPTSNSVTINSPTAIASALFGFALTKGDFDNNGYDDLAVGAVGMNSGFASSGRVYVYWADDTSHAIVSAGMVTLNPPTGAFNTANNLYLANTQAINASQNFGRALQSFKTVNGSAGIDLVVCSQQVDFATNYFYASSPVATDLGNCWIFEGRLNGGLGSNYTMMTLPKNEIRYPSGYSTPANTLYFGSGITKADWNNDTFEDLIICSSRQTNLDTTSALAGACFVFYGKTTGGGGGFDSSNAYQPNASGTRYVPNANTQIYNPNAEVSTASRFGESVLMLDINNNGTLDLIVGEPSSDSPSGQTKQGKDSGRLYIIRGGY